MGSRDPTKSSAKCQDFIHKFSSFCSCLSMLLVIALFLRVEVVRDKTEENEMRISRFESDIKSQQTVIQQGPDDKKETQSTEDSTYYVSYYRQKRNVNPATSPLSLKQIRQEIDKKLAQVCTTADKVCQPGPRGPPGDPGAFGYPGYKGDKGSPGKKGSRGRIGKIGPYGVRGKDGPQGQQGIRGEKGEIGSVGPLGRKGNVGPKGQQGLKGSVGLKGNRGEKGSIGNRGEKGVKGKEGPQGQQGIKGEKGEQGSVGPLGRKGDVGLMGQQGLKGSVGLKGNRGEKGSVGIHGPKGECVMFPKIVVFPELLEVFFNKPAVFYCWVRGVTFTSKISWSKLDGASLTNTGIRNGVLHIRHVTKSHAGALMCTALTSHGTMKAFATLRLLERPSFTSTPPPFVHVRLGSLNVCCEAEGSPIPKVEWLNAWSAALTGYSQQQGCVTINALSLSRSQALRCRATNIYGMTETETTIIHTDYLPRASCNDLWKAEGVMEDGKYWLRKPQHRNYFKAYCHTASDGKVWTLIARFSNNDGKNWMREDGWWWYDQQIAVGYTLHSYVNDDMISPAFWLSSGNEIKITRSDDSSHTSLLQTTGNCLGGQTFRSKITGYGNFRHGKVWSSNRCLGSCTVRYGGQYKSTDGFQQAECSGDIQTSNKIGFWCDWSSGDGAVMMIGGGGTDCARSDHGIGITESNDASFHKSDVEYDFGYGTGGAVAHSYSLNLWIH